MNDERPSVRNIADTAWWTALYRARESERPDALFRDPFARRLAGDRGSEISAAAERQKQSEWSMAARTHLFDELILERVGRGADMVINLAAGLDARPYRLSLPPTLTWVEVDLPELLGYKEAILQSEKPACVLERVPLDLADVNLRRELFDRLGSRAVDPVIVTEGLLIYLTGEEVALLAQDLAAPPNFRRWLLDIVSPGLLRLMQRNLGRELTQAGAALKFGPEEGPEYLKRYGWNPVDVRSLAKTGAQTKRLPLLMRLLAMLPESASRRGSLPWSGVCLMEKLPGS